MRTERFKVFELLFGSKMEEGTSPAQHAMKMYEYIQRLNQMGYWMDFELSVDLILANLLDSFAQFVLGYRMNHIVSTLPKLINVLKITKGKNWLIRRPKRLHRNGLSSIMVKLAIRRGTARPSWNLGRRWHMMLHHLHVFMSLRLILFLLITLWYVIPIVAHTYGLICRA